MFVKNPLPNGIALSINYSPVVWAYKQPMGHIAYLKTSFLGQLPLADYSYRYFNRSSASSLAFRPGSPRCQFVKDAS